MILGLHGKMGAGKDTVYERLLELYDFKTVRISYADKLKESVAALLGLTRDQIETYKNTTDAVVTFDGGWRGPIKRQTFREFLQRYGTESHREIFGQDFWLDSALPLPRYEEDLDGQSRLVGPTYNDGALYVVTDVRFPNEAERIRRLGGAIVKVVGPDENTGDHASEQTLPCDYTIDNTIRDDDFANLDHELLMMLLRVLRSPRYVGRY